MKRLLVNILSLLFCVSAMAQSDFFGGMVPVQQQKNNQPDAPNLTDSRGKKQGAWSKKYDNGNYRYQANFKDDQPVGELLGRKDDKPRTAVMGDQHRPLHRPILPLPEVPTDLGCRRPGPGPVKALQHACSPPVHPNRAAKVVHPIALDTAP